jgi:hypothetical protein
VPAPLPIRTDRDLAELRRLARRERDGRVSARLLALANGLPSGLTGGRLTAYRGRKPHGSPA